MAKYVVSMSNLNKMTPDNTPRYTLSDFILKGCFLNNILIWIPLNFMLDLWRLNSFESILWVIQNLPRAMFQVLLPFSRQYCFHNIYFAELVQKRLRKRSPQKQNSQRFQFLNRMTMRRRRSRIILIKTIMKWRGTETLWSVASCWACSSGWEKDKKDNVEGKGYC